MRLESNLDCQSEESKEKVGGGDGENVAVAAGTYFYQFKCGLSS